MARPLRYLMVAGAATAALGAGRAGATEAGPATPVESCVSTPLVETDGTRCEANDAGTTVGFRATHDVSFGTIETSASLSNQSSNAFTADRLVASDKSRIGQSSRVMFSGMKARLLDDRLTLSTQFGWSNFIDRSDPRADQRDGSARLVRVDLKLLDRPALNWSVAGEMSDVSDDFYLGQAFGEGVQLALPGRRLALSSALGWKGARLTAGYDDYRSSFGTFTTTRFSASRNGVSLTLRASSGGLRNTQAAAIVSGRTDSRSATLEFDLATIAPTLAMDEGLPASLVPKSLMIGWRQGSSETVTAGASERFDRRGIEFNAMWETPLGETSFGYWRDRRVGATAVLGQRDEKVVQLSHMVRKGDWRFGIDGMVATTTASGGSGLSDRAVALGGSIAYDVANGPRLMLQLSDDRGQMANEDDSYLTARRGQQISFSLDLTDYLRKRFERTDLRLKLDYRKQLDRAITEVSVYQQLLDRWTDDASGEGVLLSFGMKL